MKRVDVIFPAYINATIGPCGTLRRLAKNKNYLRERGYEVNIFTLDNAIQQKVDINTPVDFSKGLSFRSKIKRLLTKSAIGVLISGMYGKKRTYKLLNFYKSLNRNADLVVFHDLLTCSYYTSEKKEKQKIVCFFHSDGTLFTMMKSANKKNTRGLWYNYLKKLYKKGIKSIDKFVFIAKIGQKNFLCEHPEISENETFFLHNGIEYKPIIVNNKENSPKYRLCSVGSLNHRKGQYLIVEALSRLSNNLLKDIHLTLYGTGPDFPLISEKVEEYGLQDNVTLYGNLPNSEIHEKLSHHNIFVLMSNNEGLPISILEAMRAGLPVISTRVSGIPEEVDNRNGILINPNAEELTDVLNNIEHYNWGKMGSESRKRFETEFDFKVMLSKYCDMLDSCFFENK